MGKGQRSSVQLQLISGSGRGSKTRRSKPWLDARTRQIGREGVAQARAILSQASPPEPPGHRRAS
jgi:hypothetical protein